jgi:zinc protease
MAMNSNDAIAGAPAPYVALARTPETLNRLFDTYQKVTPADVRDAVKKYFREESRTVVTLSTKGQNIASNGGRAEGGERR